ncbi:hypothetical protein Sjap_002637 [Stephania japonica]|uniref:Uncharacterized protein n=1 Tax=Stephania japonica TaxID=461633 RepID=A0AAP0KM84_9MAGN
MPSPCNALDLSSKWNDSAELSYVKCKNGKTKGCSSINGYLNASLDLFPHE